jgi:hypothetical protein
MARDDDCGINTQQQGRNSNTINDLDRLMHLWTATNDYKDSNLQQQQQQHSPSGSSSGSSSPVSNHLTTDNHEQSEGCQKYRPLNLSTGNSNNLMCSE